MREGIKHRLPDLVQQLLKRRSPRQVGTQHERIDEVTNGCRKGRPVPAGRGRTDDDVRLSRVSIKQHLKGRQQGHVECGSMTLGQRLELARSLRIYLESAGSSALSFNGRTRATGVKIQRRRRVFQLPGPIVKQSLALLC